MSQFLSQYGLPFLGVGICLVMHLFMHKGHGNNHADGEQCHENHSHGSKQTIEEIKK